MSPSRGGLFGGGSGGDGGFLSRPLYGGEARRAADAAGMRLRSPPDPGRPARKARRGHYGGDDGGDRAGASSFSRFAADFEVGEFCFSLSSIESPVLGSSGPITSVPNGLRYACRA